MKTHISNTKAMETFINYDGKTAYTNHQHAMHTQKIKPVVDTRRKTQIKIVNNNKLELNQQPLQHVNQLFKNIISNKYKSTIDNKVPTCYETGKKILKDKLKKSPKENFVQQEHERELKSQAERIKNCKSLVQRKKDNTDPVVNPTYFMRDANETKSVTIQGYKNTVLKKNRPSSSRPASAYPNQKQIESKIYSQINKKQQESMPMYSNFRSIPNLSTKLSGKPKSAGQSRNMVKQHNDDLPQCTFKAVLNHIVDNKMYKQADIKVLYVRLCHKYGEEKVDQIWEPLMDELQS